MGTRTNHLLAMTIFDNIDKNTKFVEKQSKNIDDKLDNKLLPILISNNSGKSDAVKSKNIEQTSSVTGVDNTSSKEIVDDPDDRKTSTETRSSSHSWYDIAVLTQLSRSS